MPESTQIIVSRRNIRHNIHSTTDRQPVLFLRGPGGIVQSGFEALLEGSGRVFYQAPDLVDTHQPPVLIETEGTVLLDGGEPSETGRDLIKRVYIHQQHLLKDWKRARVGAEPDRLFELQAATVRCPRLVKLEGKGLLAPRPAYWPYVL
jgi:hypothetical protein